MNIEQELQFLQYQIWFLMVLFIAFIALNFYFRITKKLDDKDKPDFSEMWYKGDLDKLITSSRKRLSNHPNDTDALFWGAKALMTKSNCLEEAKNNLEKLKNSEPAWKDHTQELIDDIKKMQSG